MREKPFFSDQCEEIEENNRIGKVRDVFKKMTNTKKIFHPKLVTIKDRNGMDLTEAEDITSALFEFSFVILHCSLTFLVTEQIRHIS